MAGELQSRRPPRRRWGAPQPGSGPASARRGRAPPAAPGLARAPPRTGRWRPVSRPGRWPVAVGAHPGRVRRPDGIEPRGDPRGDRAGRRRHLRQRGGQPRRPSDLGGRPAAARRSRRSRDRHTTRSAPRAARSRVITGSGALCRPFHEFMVHVIAIAELRFERVVVLPSSLDPAEDVVREAIERTGGDRLRSRARVLDAIESLCDARLAPRHRLLHDYGRFPSTAAAAP